MTINPVETSNLSTQLNTAQHAAVTAPLGPLLVLAGAGSGKTRVLISRLAYLMQQHQASPYRILAVTFTNKAANEMKKRLSETLGENLNAGLWIGTFHGLGYRLIRSHAERLGLAPHFQVLDADDQYRLIKKVCQQLSLTEESSEIRQIQGFINRKKEEGCRASDLKEVDLSLFEQMAKQVYLSYTQYCQEQDRIDFADILLMSYDLLRHHDDLRAHYQAKFQHILVDEFQDTNHIQYAWLKLLSDKAQSIMVVGDDDQSIYGWRGAKIEHIQRFPQDFPGAEVIRLEQNYRSTKTILAAANGLIAHNQTRLGKSLWTEGETGELIQQYEAFNEEDEALYVVRQVKAWLDQGNALRDTAVLYRSNAQSRVLEEALMRSGLPYVIYGGLRFFERAEIKDILAYARLMLNTADNAAFDRIINLPNRGLGPKNVEKIRQEAQKWDESYFAAAQRLAQKGGLTGKAGLGLRQFLEIISAGIVQAPHLSLSAWFELLIQKTGLFAFYMQQKTEQAKDRIENLKELVNAAADFSAQQNEAGDLFSVLSDFLSHTVLESSGERKGDKEAVQLMTLHASKGLEFPLVLMVGMEEGLFPSHFSRQNPRGLEEERRLCYVGITRAMRCLHLTYAKRRRLFGKEEERKPSPFLTEIPSACLAEAQYPLFVQRAQTVEAPNPWIASWNASIPEKYPKQRKLAASNSKPTLWLGKRVNHPKFGPGWVIEEEGEEDKMRVHVRFDHVGHKWLSLAYAKLSVLEEDSPVL